jgi:uncharacterized membrane protein YjjP (DUF1212 family)
MSEGRGKTTKQDPAARIRAEQAAMRAEQLEERKNYLAWTIYAMSLFFAISLNFLWLQDVWFAIVAFASQLMSGMFDTTGWVAWWKGALSVVIICGFAVSAIAGRFLARQK